MVVVRGAKARAEDCSGCLWRDGLSFACCFCFISIILDFAREPTHICAKRTSCTYMYRAAWVGSCRVPVGDVQPSQASAGVAEKHKHQMPGNFM